MGVEGNPPVPGTNGRPLYGKAVPIRRPEIRDGEWVGHKGTFPEGTEIPKAEEWTGPIGNLPGSDADYFAFVEAGGNPEDFYKTLKEVEPRVPRRKFSFFGQNRWGRVSKGEFQVRAKRGDTWRKGHWWEEFTYRFKYRDGKLDTSIELEKRLTEGHADFSPDDVVYQKSKDALEMGKVSGALPNNTLDSILGGRNSVDMNDPVYNTALRH